MQHNFGFWMSQDLIVVVQGRHLKNASALAVEAFGAFEIGHLQHHRQTFDKEDAAENGEQQFFANQNGRHGNNAADGEAARIAHEHLRRIGVIPKKADERPTKAAIKTTNSPLCGMYIMLR